MSWVTLRCPRCGAYIAAPAPAAATSYATCPHCYSTLPVVPARDPPPLFSWEVYPSVYPALPPPRAPGRHLPTVVMATLVAATVLLAGLAGLLFVTGTSALSPGSFALEGVVVEGSSGGVVLPHGPIAGALVRVTSEAGYDRQVLTDSAGAFSFSGIPSGGATVNVTAPGFAPVEVTIFFSKPFVSAGGGNGLTVAMTPTPAQGSSVVDTPFPNLESLLTSLWSGTALLALAGVISAVGAVCAHARRRAAVSVAGGAAALVAPAAMFLLGDTTVLPLAAFATVGLSALGAVAATLGAVPMLWNGPPPEDVERD